MSYLLDCGVFLSSIKEKKRKIQPLPHRKFPPPSSQTLHVSHSLVLLKGWQAFQTSSSPSKKYPSSCHNPPVPPLHHPPSLLGPTNKNKVRSEVRVALAPLQISQWIPDCHSRVARLILLFLQQDYSLWSLSLCGCTREKGEIKGISVYPPDMSNWDVRNHWRSLGPLNDDRARGA